MSKLLAILEGLMSLLFTFLQSKKEEEHQKEVDKIEEDPHSFFNEHFNGSDSVSDAPEEPKTPEANLDSSDSGKRP